jgi:very-short-patch-repair endonuclease
MARHVSTTPLHKRVAALADRQHGAVATAQILAAGISASTITNWSSAGLLYPRHRGVWAVGHPRLSDEGRLWAAVLAARGAQLDAQSAAWSWRLLDPHPDPILLVSATKKRPRAKLRIRTRTPLPAAVVLRGLPTLNLADTLAQLPPRLRQRAKANAAYAGLLPRNTDDTETDLEDAFLALVRAAGLPEPKRQLRRDGKRHDFAWPSHRLIVEIDEGRGHDNPVAFHEDRRRDAEALVRGWRTVRFTREHIENDPAYVIATLRALLAA